MLGQTLATSGVTGPASCTTTATPFSAGRRRTRSRARQGTLDAANYSFGPFVPGTLTVDVLAAVHHGQRRAPDLGSSALQGKSIQRSVRRQTYSQLTTERGFS